LLTMCLYRAVVLLPILSLAAAARTSASNWENVKTLAPGTQIRVAADASKPGTPSQQILGTLESVTDTELVIQQGTGTQSFPRAPIISVSIKTKGRRWRNTLIGMGVGAGVGIGVGYVVVRLNSNDHGLGPCCVDGLVGAIIAPVGGTVIGVSWPTGSPQVYTR
jgi:hypothetical protein